MNIHWLKPNNISSKYVLFNYSMSIKNAIQLKNEPKAKIGKPPEGVDQLLGVDY